MTENKKTVDRYMEAFRRTDHAQILSCLTDDVEWLIPGAFHARGKEAFDKEIENDAFTGHPAITVDRLTEENDVVVAEGSVRAQRKGRRHSEPRLLRCIRNAGWQDPTPDQLPDGDEMRILLRRFSRLA